MFTGLIESIGTIVRSDHANGSARLEVSAPFVAELTLGESIAVNGACLTAVAVGDNAFAAELSPETLRATSLGRLATGDRVNLERAVRAGDRMGGHFVLGHVDATASIEHWQQQGDHWWLEVDLTREIALWVVEKGSIAVDGISLTVSTLMDYRIGFQIVPHTRAHTNLADRRAGDLVNLEADIIGKYATRLRSLT